MGALHVCCKSSIATEAGGGLDASGAHEVIACSDSENEKRVNVQQRLVEGDEHVEYNYKVQTTGVLTDEHVNVVDTTGAGDAFIGGYILTQLLSSPPVDPIQFGLEFGAWVGGKKLAGPGARSALPTGSEVDNELGRTTGEVQERLQAVLRLFTVDIA